ncbi:hypothetical protein H8E77_41240 [bacterium]|nr:hypothetical protein [bacterium]
MSEQQLDEQIKRALEEKEIPRIHFNGFISSLGLGDMMVILTQAAEPVAILNMSYTVAKTLAEKLGNSIVTLEQKSGNTIMTIDDIKEIFARDNNDTE